MNTIKQKVKSTKPKTQVIGVRLPIYEWDIFEKTCIENNKTMSEIIRRGIKSYLKKSV